MKITVVTSTYNAAKTLQTCIDSVVSQTHPDIEHIIIDGASSDGTLALIKENAVREDTRIAYWSSAPDSGIYDAWNKAIPRMTGDWVLFLGADDWLYDDEAISRMAPHLEGAHPEYIVVYGKIFSKAARRENDRICGQTWDESRQRTALGLATQMPHPATFHHRQIFDEGNRFDTSFKIAGDAELLLRVIYPHNADRVVFVDSMVTLMNVGGISSAPSLVRLKEDKRIAVANGYRVPFWYPYYVSVTGHVFGAIISLLRGKSYDFARGIWRKYLRRVFLPADLKQNNHSEN